MYAQEFKIPHNDAYLRFSKNSLEYEEVEENFLEIALTELYPLKLKQLNKYG